MTPEWLKYLLPGDFIVIGIVFIWTWFLYKNFAKRILEKIDKMVSAENCINLRNQCALVVDERRERLKDVVSADAKILAERLTSMESRFEERISDVNKKVDSILNIQAQNLATLLQAMDKK
jgi:hypothetical protein